MCAKRQKELYDNKLQFYKYKEGDVIWYLQLKRKDALCPKLTSPYTGPFLIKKKVSIRTLLFNFQMMERKR